MVSITITKLYDVCNLRIAAKPMLSPSGSGLGGDTAGRFLCAQVCNGSISGIQAEYERNTSEAQATASIPPRSTHRAPTLAVRDVHDTRKQLDIGGLRSLSADRRLESDSGAEPQGLRVRRRRVVRR